MKLGIILLAGLFLLAGCKSPEVVAPEKTADSCPHPADFNPAKGVKSPPKIVKNIYGSCSPGKRGKAMAAYGGVGSTERAVLRSLRWFKKEQNENGSWSTEKDPEAVSTGLVLLCMLAHGETPAQEEFGPAVEKGLRYLIKNQGDDGRFPGTEKNPAIEHGIITYSLCEAYGMTRVPIIKKAAEKALDVVIRNQQRYGLWNGRYKKYRADIEASVWQVLALRGAEMAGIDDDRLKPALEQAGVAVEEYIEEHKKDKTIAPAILGLQYAGLSRKPVGEEEAKRLEGITMSWEEPDYKNPVYQWFFLTRANFYQGGNQWREWNKSFAPVLPRTQQIESKAIRHRNGRLLDCGYWDSPGKKERYGRIYSTALSCMMLEVYYTYNSARHYVPPKLYKGDPYEDDIVVEIDI